MVDIICHKCGTAFDAVTIDLEGRYEKHYPVCGNAGEEIIKRKDLTYDEVKK